MPKKVYRDGVKYQRWQKSPNTPLSMEVSSDPVSAGSARVVWNSARVAPYNACMHRYPCSWFKVFQAAA